MESQLLYNISQAQQQLGGLSRSKVYEEIAAGRLRVIKIGSRTFVPGAALSEYVDLVSAEFSAEQ